MTFLQILDLVIFLTMGLFTMWQWFLAFFGSTTIEFWRGEGFGNDKKEATLRFQTVSDNLYRVFGTHKFVRIFSPSFRNVPFTGLEWSFKMKDEGYGCDGLLPRAQYERDLEGGAARIEPQTTDPDDETEMITIKSLTADETSTVTDES